MVGVSDKRWQDAQNAERGFWATEAFGIQAFHAVVAPSMHTAVWAQPHLSHLPAGEWLEIGVGPLGVGCTHFLLPTSPLMTLDPIKPVPAGGWHLPPPCLALIESCQQRTVETHIGQAENIDLPDNSFSLIALHNMLDHVQDPATVLREVRRILKPGGMLLLAIDTFSAFGEAKYRIITRPRQKGNILVQAHPHRFSAKDMIRLITASEFTVSYMNRPTALQGLAGHSFRLRVLAT